MKSRHLCFGVICLTLSLASVDAADDLDPRTKTDPASPELRRQLLQRTEKEQAVRQLLISWQNEHGIHEVLAKSGLPAQRVKEWEALTAVVKAADDDNLRWLKAIVTEVGWPTTTMVGEDGAHAAWLLVQHADADPKFQRLCLDLILQLPKQEYSQANAAYLTDRVLLAEGKPQLYGTQFTLHAGKVQPRPIDDEPHVDQRRAKVGLRPLATYAKELEELFGGKADKRL